MCQFHVGTISRSWPMLVQRARFPEVGQCWCKVHDFQKLVNVGTKGMISRSWPMLVQSARFPEVGQCWYKGHDFQKLPNVGAKCTISRSWPMLVLSAQFPEVGQCWCKVHDFQKLANFGAKGYNNICKKRKYLPTTRFKFWKSDQKCLGNPEICTYSQKKKNSFYQIIQVWRVREIKKNVFLSSNQPTEQRVLCSYSGVFSLLHRVINGIFSLSRETI